MTTEFIKTLITAGIVNGAQIERATHYESGSSLVERLLSLGYGNENDFYKVLKNKLNLPAIEASDLENISEECLNIFPRSLIEKHHILPFSIENSVLRLAVFDPTLKDVVTELSSFIEQNKPGTVTTIAPCGTLSSDLAKALNKYYKLGLPEVFKYGKEILIENYNGSQIPPLRPTKDEDFIKLPPLPNKSATDEIKSKLRPTNSDDLSKLPPLPTELSMPDKVESGEEKDKVLVSEDNPVVNEENLKQKVRVMNENFDKLSEMVGGVDKSSVEKNSSPEVPPQTEENVQKPVGHAEKVLQPENTVKKVVDLKDEDSELAACPVGEQRKDITESMTEGLNYDDEAPEFKDIKALVPEKTNATSKDDITLDSIESSNTKEEIFSNVLKELRKLSSRCLLLFVRNDTLSAVLGEGSGIVENYKGYTISLMEQSLFKDVYNSKKEYYGPIKPSALVDNFMKHFGDQRPISVTLVPATIDDQVFAIIYTEETPTVGEVKNIAKAMGNAFSKLLA